MHQPRRRVNLSNINDKESGSDKNFDERDVPLIRLHDGETSAISLNATYLSPIIKCDFPQSSSRKQLRLIFKTSLNEFRPRIKLMCPIRRFDRGMCGCNSKILILLDSTKTFRKRETVQ